MRKLFILSLSLLATSVFAQLPKASGDKILVENKEILLKGINLGNWLVPEGYMFKLKKTNSPSRIYTGTKELIGPSDAKQVWSEHMEKYISMADIRFIKEVGFNHIRLPFHYKMFNDEDYLGINNHGFAYLDSTIKWCKEVGLLVVLDMHCAPCGQTGDNIDDSDGYPFLFASSSCQDELVSSWKAISNRYKDESQLLGYGLLNEPIAHYFVEKDSSLNSGALDLYKRVVNALREQDDQHIVFVGGVQWNTNFQIFEKPFDNNLVFEFHKYWMPTVQAEIQSYIDYSKKYNVPLYLGESGENTMEWINNFRKLLENNKIGWCFWTYKKMNTDRCVIQYLEPVAYKSVIVDFLESDRSDYKSIRSNRPDFELTKAILTEVIGNSAFENCTVNHKYLKALFDDYTPINAAP